MREKVGKSRNTVFFQWFVAPEGRKVGSLKRRVRSQLARREMKNCTRSTFRSQNVQNTPFSDHFWKLRCRKSARRCGAKHISKWKCTKHTSSGPLLEVQMSKKCTPLWREAHFRVKMYKTPQLRTTFGSCDVEKARRCGAKHISKSKCTKHQGFGPLLEVAMSKKCTPLWREAHFQVKSVKNWRSRTTFGGSDVEKVSKKCTPLWRKAHLEVKSVKNWGFWAFFAVLMSKK